MAGADSSVAARQRVSRLISLHAYNEYECPAPVIVTIINLSRASFFATRVISSLLSTCVGRCRLHRLETLWKDRAMRPGRVVALVIVACLNLAIANFAQATCTLPYALTNGQVADATQVMANFNALLNCINAGAPGGSVNSVQYNAGGTSFGGVAPLTNGQVAIGSTGNAPQAATLSAGSGIVITNGAGSVTIATTGGGGGGLYNQKLSATPTSAGTGLTTWFNQGSATVTDTPVGICVNAPATSSSGNITGRYMTAPSPPYTITVLLAATRVSTGYAGAGIGWYDGTSKLHLVAYATDGGGVAHFEIQKWNSATSWNSNDVSSAANGFSQPIWLQIEDDGTTIYFRFSQDGANFFPLFSTAKSSGFLGSSGYSNVIFFANPELSQTLATLMSWTQN